MLKRIKGLIAITVIIALCYLFAGCGAKSPEEQIIGEWVSADLEVSWLFYEGGSMIGSLGDDVESAIWHIDDRNLSIDLAYEVVMYQYEINGDLHCIYEDCILTGKLYRYDGEMPPIKGSSEQLREQLEESELFADTLDSIKNENLAESVSYQYVSYEDSSDGLMDFVYNVVCTARHPYATKDIVYDVVFSYSSLSEDYFQDSYVNVGTYYSEWDIVGEWSGEVGADYLELTIHSIDNLQSSLGDKDEYVISYSYAYEDYETYWTTNEYSGEGTSTVSEEMAIIDDGSVNLIIYLDPTEGIRAKSGEALISPIGDLEKIA